METFFHCLKQFLNSPIWMPFSASAVFCFTSSTSAKHFPLRTFSIRETNKNVAQGEIRLIGRVEHKGHAVLGQKLLNTQCFVVGRCAQQSPIMKWANALKESSRKNSPKPKAASHNNASWCTDTGGFLEHSPSGGSLYYKGFAPQKIILVLGGYPPHIGKL